jgi:hypothetical protein
MCLQEVLFIYILSFLYYVAMGQFESVDLDRAFGWLLPMLQTFALSPVILFKKFSIILVRSDKPEPQNIGFLSALVTANFGMV